MDVCGHLETVASLIHVSPGEAAMASVQYLRAFVTERLTAAAAEIFGVFEKIIIEYEEEIDRQRKLQNVDSLETRSMEGRKQRSRELPQQHVSESGTASRLDRAEPQPARIKEEQEDLGTSRDEVELGLTQETRSFLLTSTYEESESEPEPNGDNDLVFHSSAAAAAQSQRPEAGTHVESTGSGESTQRRHQGNNVETSPMSETQSNTQTGEKSIECDFCGKAFKYKYNLKRHLRIHTGEKPYACNTCGKRYSQMSILKRHLKIHTGEKPYACKICRKRFCQKTQLQRHTNIHTRAEPSAHAAC